MQRNIYRTVVVSELEVINLALILQNGSLIKKWPIQWHYSHSHRCQTSSLGLRYFCHSLFRHLLIIQSEETSELKEDKPTLWKFLPKIVRAEQIAGPASSGGWGSGLFVAQQLSSMVGVFSLSKSSFGPTADFLLCPPLPFWFPREWQPHPSTGYFFGSSCWNAHTAVCSCLTVTSTLTSLLFPYQVLPWVVKNANFRRNKSLRFCL